MGKRNGQLKEKENTGIVFNLIHYKCWFFSYQIGKTLSLMTHRQGDSMGEQHSHPLLETGSWCSLYSGQFGNEYQNHKCSKPLTAIPFLETDSQR